MKDSQILKALRQLNIPPSGVLLVHSAFKHLGRHGHKPEATLDALLDYMRDGTILFPTMSWRFVREAGGEFDLLSTPSNTGILTELFRNRPDVVRSLHPTHSVAGLGEHAPSILGSHQHDLSPCGINSPFARLLNYDAWILLLGIGMDCCSLVHHAEEMVAPEIYLKPESEVVSYRCRDQLGKLHQIAVRGHRFMPRDFWQFQDRLASERELKIAAIDSVVLRAFRATTLNSMVTAELRRNPQAIVGKPGRRFRLM